MGTNYYVRIEGCPNNCGHCSEAQELHLGKLSVGWKFAFKADPDWGRDDMALSNWFKRAQFGQIVDEYGCTVPYADLLETIMLSQGGRSHTEYHGPDITGDKLTFNVMAKHYWQDRGFDFQDNEFS